MSAAAPATAITAPRSAGAEVRLVARGLAHRYAPGRGLAPVSFEIAAPALVAVTGPNGSGKSTLLRILSGLLRPVTGTAELALGGTAVPRARWPRVTGYAAPSLAFYGELTVAENLGFVADARGLARATVREVIETLGLAPHRDSRAAALSSGMTQRLRLAFALLHGPRVLLLDEPGTHLDDDGRATLAATIARHRAHGVVVMATNDEREWRLADRRIELRGRAVGDPA